MTQIVVGRQAIFDALAQSITATGIPASFEQTQRVPTGHPDVCLCDVSGATNNLRSQGCTERRSESSMYFGVCVVEVSVSQRRPYLRLVISSYIAKCFSV